jgi:hypothetical protein
VLVISQDNPPIHRNIPPTQFVLFPKLPAKIRLYIWRFILGVPRIVPVDGKSIEPGFRKGKKLPPILKFSCPLPPPILLHICHESRQETLQTYQLQLKTKEQKSPIWIDPANDIVHYTGQFRLETKLEPLLCRVQHMSYNLSPLYDWSHHSSEESPFRTFPQLRTLTMVMHYRSYDILLGGLEGGEHIPFVDLDRKAEMELAEKIVLLVKRDTTEQTGLLEPSIRVVGVEVDGKRCCHACYLDHD